MAWLHQLDEFAQYRTQFFFFFFRSGIDTPDPMSVAAYGSGLRALSTDSTKKIVPIVLLVAAGV